MYDIRVVTCSSLFQLLHTSSLEQKAMDTDEAVDRRDRGSQDG